MAQINNLAIYKSRSRCQPPSQEPPASSKPPIWNLKDMDVLCAFKIKKEDQHLNHFCIKHQWPYPNQDQDAKPRSVTSSILQSPKSGLKWHGGSLHSQNQDRAKIWIIGVSNTSDHIQSKIKMPNPGQEPSVPIKASNPDLMDMDVLCTFKSKIASQNLEHGCIKEQQSYPNQDRDCKPQSGASSILQTPIRT